MIQGLAFACSVVVGFAVTWMLIRLRRLILQCYTRTVPGTDAIIGATDASFQPANAADRNADTLEPAGNEVFRKGQRI